MDFRPNPGPDEEGIETLSLLVLGIPCGNVRTQAPMKRGLKLQRAGVRLPTAAGPNPGPDEEGIETHFNSTLNVCLSVRTQAPMKRGLKLVSPATTVWAILWSEPRPR